MIIRKKFIFVAAFTIVLLQPSTVRSQESPFTTAAPENPFAAAQVDRYIGVFESEAVKLELQRGDAGYEGSLFYAATDQTYGVTATFIEGSVEGAFNAGGTNFPFTFALKDDGTSGAFETEGYSGTLTPAVSGAGDVAGGASLMEGAGADAEYKSSSLFEEALAAADRAPAAMKPGSRFMIALFMVEAGDLDGARALAATFSVEDFYRPFILGSIASGMAAVGDFEGGYAAARAVSDESARNSALVQIIGHQAEAGDYDGALQAARGLLDVKSRVSALVAVAYSKTSGGAPVESMALLQEAEVLVNSIADKESRDAPRFAVLRAYATAGDIEKARDGVGEINSDYFKTITLSWIAQEQARAGDIEGAMKTIKEAEKKANKVEDALRSSGIIEVAFANVVAGNLAEGMVMLEVIENPLLKSAGYMRIINWQYSEGDFSGARTTMHFIDPSHKDQVTASRARALADAGVFEEAEAMARTVSDPVHLATALASVAASMSAK